MSPGKVAVFLDRDGTVNEEIEFLSRPDDLRLIDGAGPAIKRLNDSGLLTCIISNQSGIARGFFTDDDLTTIHERLKAELGTHNATIDRIYYCPHHPTEGRPPYDIDCDCRKPKPGMLVEAQKELSLDLARSFIVGDRAVDMLAGHAVGASPILVLTGYGKAAQEECKAKQISVSFVAASLPEAVDYILMNLERDKQNNVF